MHRGLTLLSTREVAQRLGVTPGCVSEWIRRGLLPAACSGQFWIVHSEDLAVFATIHRRGERFHKTGARLTDRT